jgi:hypothetical protein
MRVPRIEALHWRAVRSRMTLGWLARYRTSSNAGGGTATRGCAAGVTSLNALSVGSCHCASKPPQMAHFS